MKDDEVKVVYSQAKMDAEIAGKRTVVGFTHDGIRCVFQIPDGFRVVDVQPPGWMGKVEEWSAGHSSETASEILIRLGVLVPERTDS